MAMARQSDLSLVPTVGLPVLVTRPRDQANAFAKALVDRFKERVRPVVAPLMATEFLSPSVPEGAFAAVIFTSAHGVAGAIRLQVPLPKRAYCVGRATADAATRAGFDARSADGNAASLAGVILSDPPGGPLLYLQGVDTTGELDKLLIKNDLKVLSLQVYLQKEVQLQGEPLDLLGCDGPLVVPLFSPRSARLFCLALPLETRASLRLAAMSDAVAAEASAVPHEALIVAAQPDVPAMLDAIEGLLAPPPAP
jgi:uroporphyrinogen-III synthase